MGVLKTTNHICIKIKMKNLSLEAPVSSKAPNQDLKDIDIHCTYKFKIKSKNLEHGWTKDQWPCQNQDLDAKPQSGTSSVLQSPPSQDFRGTDCLCTLKNQDKEPKFRTWVTQRRVTIFKSRSRCPTLVRNLQHPPKPKIRTVRKCILENYKQILV